MQEIIEHVKCITISLKGHNAALLSVGIRIMNTFQKTEQVIQIWTAHNPIRPLELSNQ